MYTFDMLLKGTRAPKGVGADRTMVIFDILVNYLHVFRKDAASAER